MTAAQSPSPWLPDWRRENLYPDHTKMALARWPWQFLSRNPAYQRAWEERVRPFYSEDDGYDHAAAMDWARAEAEQNPIYRRSGDTGIWEIRNPISCVAEEFGLAFLPPPPSCPDIVLPLQNHFIRYVGRPLHLAPDETFRITIELEPGEIHISLNLAWPISAQTAKAQKFLEGQADYLAKKGAIERIKKRSRVEHWRNYVEPLGTRSLLASC